MMVMQDMLKDFLLGEHLLLVGNQVNEDSILRTAVCRDVCPLQYREQSPDLQWTSPERWRHAMKHSCVCKASAHQLQSELELSVPYGAQALAHALHLRPEALLRLCMEREWHPDCCRFSLDG